MRTPNLLGDSWLEACLLYKTYQSLGRLLTDTNNRRSFVGVICAE